MEVRTKEHSVDCYMTRFIGLASSARRLAGHLGIPYSRKMSPLRARVEKGRLVLDEPTTLPEGTVVDLVDDDEGDDLNNEERRALHEALWVSRKSAEAGSLPPGAEILEELRRRRLACSSNHT